MINPAMAYPFDLSTNSATRFTTKATGGVNSIRIPTRVPIGEPHPGLRRIRRANAIKGANESQNPVFPTAMLRFLLNNRKPGRKLTVLLN